MAKIKRKDLYEGIVNAANKIETLAAENEWLRDHCKGQEDKIERQDTIINEYDHDLRMIESAYKKLMQENENLSKHLGDFNGAINDLGIKNIFIDESLHRVTIKFNDNSVSVAYCDPADSWDPIVGFAVAYTKHFCALHKILDDDRTTILNHAK